MFLFVFTTQATWAQSGEWKDYAANGYASGDGSKDNPYVIKTAAQLAFMAKEVASTDKISKEKYYVLDADIDLGAHYWNPIGVDSPGNRRFYGKFDGKGHTVKNLKVQWIISGWTTAGLFGRVQGASNDWARISNLVIDGASIAKKTDGTNLTGNGCSIGILAGEVRQYSEISNIIVKNSANSDGGSSFEVKNSAAVRIGGVIGNTEKDNDNNPGVYRIFNLAAENVKIEYPNMKYNSSSTDSYVGGIIGRFRQKKADDSNNIFAENLFSDVTINYVSNAKITCGSVLANKDGVAEANHWYYTKPVPGVTNYGENKGISFASSFNNLANSFVSKMNEPDMPYWIYTQASGFKFLKGTLSNVHESTHLLNAHEFTFTTTGSYTYEWYVEGVKQSSTTNKATLPTKSVEQTGKVVLKSGTEKIAEISFVIPAEIYGVEDHLYANSYAGGNGTPESPYIISNDIQLAKLALDVSNGQNTNKYYRITADIDLSKAIWTPIGSYVYDTNKTFKGSLDGVGHTVRNMQFDWYNPISDKCRFGLFTTIEGTSEKWSDVKNLIIDNAKIKCDNASKLAQTRYVGTLVGVIRNYSKIQNIIVRNSQITGPSSPFAQNGQYLVLGGLAAYISDNNNNYNLNNIAVDVNINVEQLDVNNAAKVYIGGFTAECQKNVKTCVNNVYSQSTINVPSSCENVGSVFGIYFDNVSQTTLYYVNGAKKNQGTQKALNEFAVSFCNANNNYIKSKKLQDFSSWYSNKTDNQFYFDKLNTELSIDKKSMVVVTASTWGMNGSENYNWFISEDSITWKKSDLSATKILTLPYEGNVKYVYAEVADGSSRSKGMKISTFIKADAFLTKTNGTYGVNLTNSLWNDDNQYLEVSYQWKENDSVIPGATSDTYTPSGANKKVSCHIILSSGEYTILDKTLFSATVVFLKPDGGDDNNSGLDDQHPVKTWQKAYSLLEKDASWDENKIVLIGKSNREATCDQDNGNKGFSITNTLKGNGVTETYAEWKKKVDASGLAKAVTITGKYNGIDYNAIIEAYEDGNNGKGYIGLFGDTRFENITFNHDSRAQHSSYIFCQYHNLEMGEGIQMTGFKNNAPGYGTIDGARTSSFQIYGGLNNDKRFRTNNGVLDMAAMEAAMPHGKEGFSITLKSGHYSCITLAGRQSTSNQLNGLMGTPNMPIKCTITIDIDRAYNDEHNEFKADYDCGIVAASHEGPLYADMDIIIKSGYVARVVNGHMGNEKNFTFNYNGKNYRFPDNTYSGRANILIDPRDGAGNIDNSKVIITELYGGSTGRGYLNNTTIKNPFYGYSTVTINGGTFTILPENNEKKNMIFNGIFGSGAGGYNGIGDDEHHTMDEHIAYWSPDNKVVLYGPYEEAKGKFVSVKCYNANDGSTEMVDPTKTKTRILIKDGIFGSQSQPIDGVYAGGSGFMSPSLFYENKVVPSIYGGNIYGEKGETVSSLTIEGGTFYCDHGIFAGGRGTSKYYSEGAYSGTPANYTELGKTYGNVKLEINGGTFNCDIFGGGYGAADAKLYDTSDYTTLENMARVYGKTTVTIDKYTVINGSVYGGGDMAAVENGTDDATDLTIGGNVVIHGDVFASGNGRRHKKNPSDEESLSPAYTYTRKENNEVGFIRGNARLTISGNPRIYGDIYGGGAYGSNVGNTTVTVDGGYFYRNIYGGGQGDLATMTKATIDGNATVTLSGAKAALDSKETTSFIGGLHTVYGGGYMVASVTGTASVNVTRGWAGSDIMETPMWANAYNPDENGEINPDRNFCVYGGGYGLDTSVGNTDININIDIDEDNVILASVGGSFAGEVKNNTSTTIKGMPILRSVYGGGYGTVNDKQDAAIVYGNTSLSIEGGKMYCNIYGGGKGIGAKNATYGNIARVFGNTSVTVTGTAAIYGNVYGGGDVANVGKDKVSVNYSIEPTQDKSSTYVNITGGNIFGQVFGGGYGRMKAEVKDYTQTGRVIGNTLVHVAKSEGDDGNEVEPYIWNRIYGAGSYGTVDGNSKVHIEGGNLGYNVFGGGLGDASTDTPETGAVNGTYANVLGNTYVTIDGGSWIWYAMADIDGNITTWDRITTKLTTPFETWRNMPEADRMALIKNYVDNRFFNKNEDGYKFAINYNIYGGGRAACYVGSNGANTGKSTVIINHSPLTDDVKFEGKTYNLLDPNTAAGCCWYSSVDNVRNPQFSVFGAGYGMNTKVKDTEVYAQPGAKLDATGGMLEKNKYVNQQADLWKYVEFEQDIYDSYQAVDDDTRRRLYGMGENTNDPRTYLRYRASQLAWSMGAPAFTFMDIHGGGFSGYVTGNTKVETDCQLYCRSVFGGGIGSKPTSTPTGKETYGQVAGNTDVKIYGGIISMNVFGGGAGIEPYAVGGKDIVFPDMALVKGKTNVEVYGESYKISYLENRDIERTLIFGSVYGGGDVANVGTPSSVSPAKLTGTESSYTTKVSIKGASVMSAVFAGGNGRYKSSHYDYTKIGAVYGNAGLFVDKADKAYPYESNTAAPSTPVIPYLWNRAYGGGNKGVIYGNTLVKINNGYFSDDVFAGGLGDATRETSADVTGNTNLIVNGGEAKLTSLWQPELRAWAAATKNATNNHLYSPQYDPEKRKFKVNHNMYGGGNLACVVRGNSYITMTKGMLNEQETVSATANPEGGFFATKEWKEVYYKTGSPYFCIFGGGYGNQTYINGNTYVNVSMEENGSVHIDDIEDRVEGKEYLHFIPGQSVMDIVGGGYEGKVIGETYVNIGGGTFARRVFGGGQYNSVQKSNVNILSIDCEDVFGGGMMGDIEKTVNVNVGVDNSAAHEKIHIHGNVYGGNDVAGYVNLKDKDEAGSTVFKDNGGEGINVIIRSGHIYGNVYGAGNGDYLYALDKTGQINAPTVNEYYRSERNVYDLVFTVPMRSTIAASASNATDAQKIVNLSSWRPLTNKVTVDIAGKSASSKPDIRGNVYGGGNSATVVKTDDNSHVTLNVGSNIQLGGLFLGCDGEQLFTQTETKDYMRAIKDIDGINLNDEINWNNAANKNIANIYVPADDNDRPKAYPHILDLYFQPVAMSIRPKIKWCVDAAGNEHPENLKNTTIGSFVCGGNRGNMDVVPDNDGNAVRIEFPEGLTITDKIVGGCFNANYIQNKTITVDHVGGYLLGESRTTSPMIDLTVKCKFAPSKVEKSGKTYYEGGNVYGGCYQSGVIVGDVKIDYRSNSLNGLDENLLAVSNENDIAACNIYGAGYGESSYVYGDINVLYSNQVPWRANNGTTANNVFGGGQKGNVIGNTDIRILNGKVLGSVTGGSYAGYLWGSAQVLVGYPSYYLCTKSAKYDVLRADNATANLNLNNTYYNASGQPYTTPTIKQSLYIMAGDIVSEQVFDAIKAKDESQVIGAFGEKITTAPSYSNGWNDVNIQIGVAVYGGGYSTAASGTSLNNTTVLRYTDKYNNVDMKYSGAKEGNCNYANGIDIDDVETVINYGGNTTMLIADDPSYVAEHITISPQTMKVATDLANDADLFQKYYMANDGNYHFISTEGKYFKNGPWPADMSSTDHNFYESDTEGGIFGDGHLSYTEGFRNCELSGYGYASHSISAGKILNTFQRMDMLRLKDNCIKLLGARDYATSSTDVTPYSISRVAEIQMVSSLDGDQPLTVRKDKINGEDDPTDPFLFGYKKRNYLGLSNNIRYVGAIKTNDDFATAKWHGKDGLLGQDEYAGLSYQDVKIDYLKYHQYKAGIVDKSGAEKNEIKYQKRNEGTARNLIGIASGYALRIRNVQEKYNSKGKLTESPFYGPIVGVAEIRLVNVDPDEAGGYVYADDRHDVQENLLSKDYRRSLLRTGNFVFPYVENPDMFVVDDCFPNGWEQNKIDGKQNSSHYWYLTGYHFYLNANISAFTYNSADNAMEFESNSEINENDVEVLKGLVPIPEEKLSVISWSLRSDHPTTFESDLEKRNYEDDAKDHSGYDLKDKYKLYVGISDKAKYSDDEVHYELPMKFDSSITKGTILPGEITSDISRLSFKLVDNADNTSVKYYKDHMEKPTKATLVLRAPAFRSDGNGGYVTDNTKMAMSVFYYYDEGEYKPTGSKLTAGTAYYFRNVDTGEYEKFYDGNSFLNNVYTKSDNQYSEPLSIDKIKPTTSNVYYIDVERSYTYTIYLNIRYIQGPSPEGNITIANCALPGEYIKVDASTVTISADQSMRPQNFYWRIGKLNAEGTAFKDDSPWKKEDVNDSSKGYQTWQFNTEATGIFAECEFEYDDQGKKRPDILYVPAYYYMNGYGVQYGFSSRESRNNEEDDEYVFYPIDIKKDETTGKILDRLEVHNFHMMDSHDVDINLRLDEAVERAKDEPDAQPRIYIGDEADIKAFEKFVSTNKYHGAHAQFILLNDLVLPPDYIAPEVFEGTLHGDGHMITEGRLFRKNKGNIYNLGYVNGQIARTNEGKYHCCFESKYQKVYDIDGNDVPYTADDFKYGKVAYDLNQYNMKKAANVDSYTYVEDYYRNGDFQYARIDDETLGVTSGVTYLRKGNEVAANQSVPYYHKKGYTAHNMKHTADVRSKGDYCEPLFESKGMNDYRYFGQNLQAEPALYPSTITSHNVTAALNRVWRTDGYYGNKQADKFYYNAAIHNDSYMDTYVLNPKTTAVNFNVADDNASVFHGFGTADEVTRNLLVYTAKNDKSKANEAVDVVSKSLAYDENTPEGAIRGHHVINNNGWKTSMLHLVDKQTFNAPIAFTVTGRSWYVRNPETETGYVEKVGAAWESICLPFAPNKSTLSEGIQMYKESNGAADAFIKNITFFYGTPAAGTSVAKDNNTLRHHYWFREFKSVSGNMATFSRPENSISKGGFVANTPYIVSFPGSRYYEFDMTGQTITFEKTNSASIAVTDDDVAAATTGKPYHVAFSNEEASADKYAIAIGETGDSQGMKFEKNQPIYAFRGYMTQGNVIGAKANSLTLDDDVIYISTDIRNIESLDENENTTDVAGEYLRVYDAGNHAIGVESSYDTKLTIYTSAGQIARILDVRAGTSKYSGFASGIYIIGQKKLSVK